MFVGVPQPVLSVETAPRYEERRVRTDRAGIEAGGDGPVAELFDLVFTGDITSLEMAAAEGLDPGPLPVVDDLKNWLNS